MRNTLTRLAGGIALSALLAGPSAGQTPEHPNVLILVADDLGWTDLEAVPTPHLDGLAENGVSYTRFYAMPVCSPTRYALLFGRFGRRDGIGRVISSYAPPSFRNPTPQHDLLTLPKLAKALGYRTGLFGKWHLGSNHLGMPVEVTPHLHGFDVFRAGSMSNLGSGGGSGYFDWRRVDDGASRMTSRYATAAMRDETIRWWRRTRGPKLALVAFNAPHGPYHAPPPEDLPPGWPTPTNIEEQFRAMIASMDLAIGRILAEVDLANTLVVFLSDNGAPNVSGAPIPPPDDPEDDGKHTTLESGIRVPMLIAGPGVVPGKRCAALVHAVDLLATLGDRLGAASFGSAGEDSVSFAETFGYPGSFGKRKWVFSEFYGREFTENEIVTRDDQALVTRRYKLRVEDGIEMVFDLDTDPDEENPLDLDQRANAAIRDVLVRILAEQVPPRLEEPQVRRRNMR